MKQLSGQAITTLLTRAGYAPDQFHVKDHGVVAGDRFVTVEATESDVVRLHAEFCDVIEAGGYWAWLDYPGVSVIPWDPDLHGPWT